MTVSRPTARAVRSAAVHGFGWTGPWRIRTVEQRRRRWLRSYADAGQSAECAFGPFIDEQCSGDRTCTSGATTTTS